MSTTTQSLLLIALIAALALPYATATTANATATGGVIVLDVRNTSEWNSRHVSCAHHLPIQEAEPASLVQKVKELALADPRGLTTPVVTYCYSGKRAGIAKEALEEAGFTNVRNGGGYIEPADNAAKLEALCSSDTETTIEGIWDNVKGFFNETWAQALLGAMGMVLIGLVVYMTYTPAVTSEAPTPAPTMQPTTWYEGVGAKITDGYQTVVRAVTSTFAKLFGKDESDVQVDANAVQAEFDRANGRRSDSGNGIPVQISSGNSADAYQTLQTLSTTSGATITTMLVQQLQAANYTGPMPTMVTTVVTSVTDAGSSSSSSDSNTTMIAVAIVVAAALVLVVVLVAGALIYMYKLNKAPAAQATAAPSAPPIMGNLGVTMNPVHKPDVNTPTAYIA